jgi:hypothetical protein
MPMDGGVNGLEGMRLSELHNLWTVLRRGQAFNEAWE